jgi:imidazolonepropionase-like amidohydrolase
VLVSDGKVESIVEGSATGLLQKGARQLDCAGKFIVAGFRNSHAHFETGWQNAAEQPAEKLESHMQDMVTRWGVTAVWDLGSEVNNTLALRRRVESGEVSGPEILMAGDIFPKNGHAA